MLRRILIFLLFIVILVGIIFYTRGYRFNIEKYQFVPNGILMVSSFPTGGQIYLNGELKGATNTNITVPAGVYSVQIKKEGYTTWKDEITVKGEIVSKIDALLFPLNPSLMPITSIGVERAFWSESGERLILYSSSDDEANEKGGLYVLDASKRTLSIFNPLRLILSQGVFSADFPSSELTIEFAPDSRDILVQLGELSAYLIPTDSETANPIDVLRSIDVIRARWEELRKEKTTRLIHIFKEPVKKIASDSFKIISFSPDETKCLYTVNQTVDLPRVIDPPLIGSNTTPENRSLTSGNLYIYDTKEDKNYAVMLDNTIIKESDLEKVTFLWYVDSQHIIVQKQKQIAIMNYDSKHYQTVYSGPFKEDFIAVSGDGRILILTNLNPDSNLFPDIYAVGIR